MKEVRDELGFQDHGPKRDTCDDEIHFGDIYRKIESEIEEHNKFSTSAVLIWIVIQELKKK